MPEGRGDKSDSGVIPTCLLRIENLKTVANLINNKDIFMCIIRFNARAGYLYQYETLLMEINFHPDSDSEEVPPDQYAVEPETVALADRNLNMSCESRIRCPSLIAMLNRWDMRWLPYVRTKSTIYLYIPL